MKPTPPKTTEEAITKLMTGNARFAKMRALADSGQPIDSELQGRYLEFNFAPAGQIEKQSPFGAVLACADARVPAEIIFDTGPNRLFVVRVAGNVLGDECMGSLEYATAALSESLKCHLVIGHVGCGGVNAAVQSYLNPKGHSEIAFSRSLRAVINHVLVAVRSSALSMEQVFGPEVEADPGYTAALSELSVYVNAAVTAYQLRAELPDDAPGVYFGVYDLGSSKVGFPQFPDRYEAELRPAPRSANELVEIGVSIAKTMSVRQHLKGHQYTQGFSC